VARSAERPLTHGDAPERDDEGNVVEAVFPGQGQVLLRDVRGYVWLEPADFVDDPRLEDASWHRRDLGDLYWRDARRLQ
jgi:hypothetical protein